MNPSVIQRSGTLCWVNKKYLKFMSMVYVLSRILLVADHLYLPQQILLTSLAGMSACCLPHANFLFGLLFDPKDGDIFLWNIGSLSRDYMIYPRR
jgi:hypothetical protein